MVVLLVSNSIFIKTVAVDEIIDVSKTNGVDLSIDDVTDIAIFTLHSIVTANSGIEVDVTKKMICEIIGNDSKIGEYLFTTLCGISATDDELMDEINASVVSGGV